MHRPGWIRKFHKSRAAGGPPLLIFPHAGAGASTYRAFSKAFSRDFDVIVFQYPGRQDRAHEPLPTSLPELAAGALAEFRNSAFDRGTGIYAFGHSMGALVSFEFVRLAEAAGISVRQLTVSAAVPPARAEFRPPTPTGDEELLDHLTMLEGMGSDVLDSREIMRMALPVLQADHRASDAYSPSPEVELSARIHALGGEHDPIVSIADLHGWRRHSDDVEVTVFEGGHFFLNDHVDTIAAVTARRATVGPAA
ncbi:surfactin synthase thioesterase subunit [Nocardia transvalensis]|uniref:Thioesterase TesA n=1 Tax=Nocardia transvalensis TaxID=37333 RepID=A0A7W9PBB1_9NOCA|nr:alpha/beta fold hydrolase [Nocardia transvalensis]MBB5912909.1 surfactin synthase thioesterase subunit [Nocardia transvalensis]